MSRPTDALVDDVPGRRDRERPNPRDRVGQRHKGRDWPNRLRCGRWKAHTECAAVRNLRSALNRRLHRKWVYAAAAGASRSLGWPNAVHDRQLGARVVWRHPRVGRSEVRESRIAKGSVTMRRVQVIDASRRRAARRGQRPLPIQTRHTVGSTVRTYGSTMPTVRLHAKARRSFPNTQRRAFCFSRLPDEAIRAESRRAERGSVTAQRRRRGAALRLFPQSQTRSARSAPGAIRLLGRETKTPRRGRLALAGGLGTPCPRFS